MCMNTKLILGNSDVFWHNLGFLLMVSKIEKGRYSGIARSDRICMPCQLSVEGEYHFVLICDIYKDLRDKCLPRQIVQSPSVFKFNRLLSVSNE